MTRPPTQSPDTKSTDVEGKGTAEQGLIRELWALLLVYGTLVILPLLTGIACES